MNRYWIAIALGLSATGACGAELDNAAAQSLMKKHGCTACHEVDKKVVGPAFREVATRYKDDKDAQIKLVNKVKKGGAHVWGEHAMPPNVLITDGEVRDIVSWILALKK